MVPESAMAGSIKVRMSVLFPEPFLATMAIFSPSEIPKVRSVNSVLIP